jgi:hypothetical protein
MKKILFLVSFLLIIGLAEAANVALSVTWQLSSSVVRPGSDFAVYITVTNPGLDVTGVTLTASPGPYLKLTSGNKIELGDVPATNSQQTSITAKADDNAVSAISYIYMEAKYYYGNTEYKRTFYVPITIRRDPLLEIRNIQFSDSVEPGKTIIMTFDIFNAGDMAASDLSVKLNSTNLFITPESSGEKVIGRVDPSQTQTINFPLTINPEADIGIENIPVFLTYYDDTKTNNYTQIKNIGLKITGSAEFVISIDSYNSLYYGRMGEVKIYIANKGTAPADYISVDAKSEFGSKSFYIGSLSPDDSETMQLPQTLTTAFGKYPIHLVLSYRDRFGDSYTFEKDLEAVPSSAPFDFSVIILIIVALLVAYWLYRRRKKK